MPQEDKFNSNAKSPRFSTSKAIGFKGGQQPSYQQVSGINPVAPPTSPKPAPTGATVNPAISQFEAPRVSQPSLGGTLATGAGSAVAGEAAKAGVKSAVSGIANSLGMGSGAGPGTLEAANAPGVADPFGKLIEGNASNWGVSLGAPDVQAVGGVEGANFFDVGGVGDAANYGSDIGASFADTADLADFDMRPGFELTGGAGDVRLAGGVANDTLGEAAGVASGGAGFADFLPYAPAAINLARGNVKGAALSAGGAFLGNMVLPGIGGGIGAAIGSALGGGCFITEAVMSAGGAGDTAPELESLRQFRDQVLSTTPQGQALIQEYESIAPMVVEAVMQRPDSLQIFQSIDAQFINPAVEAVNQGDFQKALQIYGQMISFVTPFAMEGSEGDEMMPAGMGGDMDAMQKMGEHAAMIGHSPEMAGAATGDMGMAGLDEDPNGYDGGPQGPQGQSPMMQQFATPRY